MRTAIGHIPATPTPALREGGDRGQQWLHCQDWPAPSTQSHYSVPQDMALSRAPLVYGSIQCTGAELAGGRLARLSHNVLLSSEFIPQHPLPCNPLSGADPLQRHIDTSAEAGGPAEMRTPREIFPTGSFTSSGLSSGRLVSSQIPPSFGRSRPATLCSRVPCSDGEHFENVERLADRSKLSATGSKVHGSRKLSGGSIRHQSKSRSTSAFRVASAAQNGEAVPHDRIVQQDAESAPSERDILDNHRPGAELDAASTALSGSALPGPGSLDSSSDASKVSSAQDEFASPGPNFDSNSQFSRANNAREQITAKPSCPIPDFSTTANRLTLLQPLRLMPNEQEVVPGETKGVETDKLAAAKRKPLLVYLPGMDATGQGIRSQIPFLYEQGYDIRCVYIPSSDRSTWPQLVADLVPLLRQEATVEATPGSGPSEGGPQRRSVTLLAESFGCCLALRVARAAPELVSRLVLVNPATGFPQNNALGSLAARTGLLAYFPPPLYEIAQDILLPFLVKRNRVTSLSQEDMLSPLDYVPAACAAWRLALLNDGEGLEDPELARIQTPTLLVAGAKDRMLPTLAETTRLQGLLPNAVRTVLPKSGHTVFLEDGVNIAATMHRSGFDPPAPVPAAQDEEMPALGWRRDSGDAELDARLEELGRMLEPWRVLTSPLVSGDEMLPSKATQRGRGVLFVGNHTLFGLYDAPLLVHELYLRGFRCRGLAHPGHWLTGIGGLMERYGNVKASPRAAYSLLKQGEHVLLFPGGAREVCKRKGEAYQLQWRERADFVRMASRLGALIVPFGALGGDDAFKLLYDSEDILKSPAGPLIDWIYAQNNLRPEEAVYPITALPGTDIPSLLPVPAIQRIYFHFGEPIDTAAYGCNLDDAQQCQELYELVRTRVESSIAHLMEVRAQDPERELPTRLVRKAMRLLPEFSPRDRG